MHHRPPRAMQQRAGDSEMAELAKDGSAQPLRAQPPAARKQEGRKFFQYLATLIGECSAQEDGRDARRGGF